MKDNYENVFYTPKFSNRSTISVRRLASYMRKPMTKTVDLIIEILPYMFDSEKVCKSCENKNFNKLCDYCSFNNPKLEPEEQIELFSSL